MARRRTRWRGRSRDWVERKYADYHLTKRKRQRNIRSKPYRWNKSMGYPRPVTVESHRKVQVSAARRATAKRGATRGAVYSLHAAKGAARLGTRAIPVVGWAMFAYDVYHLGKYLHDKYGVEQVVESTPKLPYDIEPWIESPEYLYPVLTGYEDSGPVHWSRTV